MAKPLLKRFDDAVEFCREAAIAMTTRFVALVKDLTPHLPYIFSAIMRRLPAVYEYDADMQVAVTAGRPCFPPFSSSSSSFLVALPPPPFSMPFVFV